MDKRKILFVNPYSSSKGLTGESCGCGAEESLFLLIKNLDKTKFKPIVVYPLTKKTPDAEEKYKKLGINLIFASMNVLGRSASFIEVVENILNFIPSLIKLIFIIKKEKINIVYTNSSQVVTSGISAKICNVKSIYHIRQLIVKPKILRKILAKMIDMISDKIICISTPVAHMFWEKGISKEKAIVIFNGVNLERFTIDIDRYKIRKEFGIENEKVIGIVGRLDPRKGHIFFINSIPNILEKFPNSKFMVIGDIDNYKFLWYKKSLMELIEKLNIKDKVIFTGFRADMPEVISSLDCLVLASSREKSPEPFGRVLIEAMAVGTPVVATDNGGAVDIILDAITGFLILPKDSSAISKAVISILSNPGLTNSMKGSARKRVEEFFSLETTQNSIEKTFL